MNNTLISNMSLYTIGNMLPKAASFFLLPIYTSYLDPSEFGIVGAMTVIVAFLSIFLTLNFERSIFRLMYDYKDDESQKIFLGTIFIWVFIFSSSVVITLFLCKDYVSKFYTSIDFYPYFLISILTVYFTIFGEIPRVFLQVKQRAKTFVLLSLVQFILTNCSILYFVVYLQMKADGYLLGGLISAVLMLPFFLWYTCKIVSFTFDKNIFKVVSKFSLPIFPAVISAQLINLSDRVFIEKYLSITDLGLYSLAYSIAGIVLVFTSSFKKAYDPFFYKIANTLKQEEAKEVLKKTNTIYYIVTLLVCFFIAIVSKEIIELFFNENYLEAYRVVPIICIAYAIFKISGLINLSFYQNKNTKLMMYISLASAVLNILLNFLLIPRYGYFGAAYATAITYFFMLLIKYYFSRNEFFIEINFKRLLFLSSILFAFYFFTHWLNLSIILSLSFKTIFIIFVSLLLFLLEMKNLKFIKSHV
ncbi:oligosaccharide flippase family protein [bacterium]|nr:oligosaccharide flippase family protein [bacterium]